MSRCTKITSEEMRRNLITMLIGDVEKMEEMITASHHQPVPIAGHTVTGTLLRRGSLT